MHYIPATDVLTDGYETQGGPLYNPSYHLGGLNLKIECVVFVNAMYRVLHKYHKYRVIYLKLLLFLLFVITCTRQSRLIGINIVKVDHTSGIVTDWSAGQRSEPRAGHLITFFGNKLQPNCRLATDVHILGCGYDGHAFSATLICGSAARTIVLKVAVKNVHKARPGEPKQVYVSAGDLDTWDRVRSTLWDNTTRMMRRRFTLPIGTVSVPTRQLLVEIDRERKESQTQHRCLLTLPSHPPVDRWSNVSSNVSPNVSPQTVGMVMEFAGVSMNRRTLELSTSADLRNVVREIVCIYRHMYERRFIHLDISYDHFSYDPRHGVALIDFTRHRILSATHPSLVRFQWGQLFQLLSLVGNVCVQQNRFRIKNRISMSGLLFDTNDSRVTSVIERDIVQWDRAFTSALERCEFDAQPSPTPLLFGLSTDQIYQTLSQWTGGCLS